jgi:hypothetical protein
MKLDSRTHHLTITPTEAGKCEVELLSPYFGATVEMSVEPGETWAGAASLNELYELGAGHVEWRAKDGALRLLFVMAKKGELHITVQVTAEPDFVDELTCLIEASQDELPRIASELRALS